ncbi:hypothetical protein I314_03740 [Cryptococcus bacillisporus CA1873]|uniref:Ca3427-like PBP 2 domain-containing protein n=1 Tax=Cryptococcus bacillisporus CA1873 TaxID=1296111 RepID=A0ABR5BA32_CRYGA|nr:hypothetical protein I314_03740 [Cryptococcus bacillisporus CA1873]|eukprot:KIR60445.1 hypothetical protein I314_03740 [Cryptococcus gattii CA1873]
MATKLRVGWHREHFLSPLLQFVEKDKGGTVELVECPGGTGEMQVKLKNGEIDLCIGTPGSLKRRIINNSFKRLPTLSSRVWQTARRLTRLSGDISRPPCDGKDSQYNSINDLKGTTFGISRLGSGSQVMASVLSLQQKWSEEEQPKFKVNGQFKPLRDSVNSGETSVFLWEWFTTKPYVDSGEVRFIGSVYTPWPCWHIAASPSVPSSTVGTFLASLQPYVQHFNSPEARVSEDIEFVHNFFGHKKEDVAEWLQSVKWEEQLAEVKEDVVKETLAVLRKAGVVPEGAEDMKLEDIVNTEVATIV